MESVHNTVSRKCSTHSATVAIVARAHSHSKKHTQKVAESSHRENYESRNGDGNGNGDGDGDMVDSETGKSISK